MDIDMGTIRELIDMRDSDGVLSIYVGHAPNANADQRPSVEVATRGQIRALVDRISHQDKSTGKKLERLVEGLEPQLAGLLDPRRGRGQALFVGVDSGRAMEFTSQLPFRSDVSLTSTPNVAQLLAMEEVGRACGVVDVSRNGLRLVRWSFGEARDQQSWQFVLPERSRADVAGPGRSANSTGFRGDAFRDQFGDHFMENYARFLRSTIREVAGFARDQHWQRVIVSGSPKLRDLATQLLADYEWLRVILVNRSFEQESEQEVADHIWPILWAEQRAQDKALVATAVDRALAGGAGALGLRSVCDALNEGRVAHLLLEDDLRVAGFESTVGTLHPDVGGLVAAADVPMRLEPDFVDRMVQVALQSDAAATVVPAAEIIDLRDHEGVAAILRW